MHTVFIFLEFLVVVNAIPTNDMIGGTAGERERERKRVLIIPSDDLKSHKYGSLILVD
jgi:hypothetical protein